MSLRTTSLRNGPLQTLLIPTMLSGNRILENKRGIHILCNDAIFVTFVVLDLLTKAIWTVISDLNMIQMDNNEIIFVTFVVLDLVKNITWPVISELFMNQGDSTEITFVAFVMQDSLEKLIWTYIYAKLNMNRKDSINVRWFRISWWKPEAQAHITFNSKLRDWRWWRCSTSCGSGRCSHWISWSSPWQY